MLSDIKNRLRFKKKCEKLSLITYLSSWLILLFAQHSWSLEPSATISYAEPLHVEEISYLVDMDSDAEDAGKNVSKKSISLNVNGNHILVMLDDTTVQFEEPKKNFSLPNSFHKYSGYIDGLEGSWVSLSSYQNNWSGMVFDGRDLYFIDPVETVEPLLPSWLQDQLKEQNIKQIWYMADDVESDLKCGMDDSGEPMSVYGSLQKDLGEIASIVTNKTAEVVFLANYVYSSKFETSEAAYATYLQEIGFIQDIYKKQVQLNIFPKLIQIDEKLSFPSLTSSNAITTLDAFQRVIYSNFEDTKLPDFSYLTTGSLNGVGGVAFMSSACSNNAVGLGSGSTEVGMVSVLIAAHEIAHILGSPHDGEGACKDEDPLGHIMAPSIQSIGSVFSSCSLSQMDQFMNSASCIEIERELIPSGEDDLNSGENSGGGMSVNWISFSSMMLLLLLMRRIGD